MPGDDSAPTPADRVLPSQAHPTRWDTHEANKTPNDSFLAHFKERLLQSEDARNCEELLPPDGQQLPWPLLSRQLQIGQYTYPLWVMASSTDENIDVEEELRRLRPSFPTSLKNQIYLDRLDLQNLRKHDPIPPPYLEAALASLACLMSKDYHHSRSHSLFMIGVRLFIVILEVDNREARKVDGVLAGILLSTYGLLTTDSSAWRVATNMLTFSTTALRRLTPSFATSENVTEATESPYSLLVCFVFLIDTLCAVHFNKLPGFSTAELKISMPTSDHSFQAVYNCLFNDMSPLPNDVRSPEDGLLLLVAMLSDMLFLQRNICSIANSNAGSRQRRAALPPATNPFATLTPTAESLRQQNLMENALDRWLQHFPKANADNVLAFYYFCRLCLSCPNLWLLADMVNYTPKSIVSSVTHEDVSFEGPSETGVTEGVMPALDIGEEALHAAWRVLDHVDTLVPRDSQSVWLPIILFFSALVVWYKAKETTAETANSRYMSMKALAAFSRELDKLPWPCCTVMSATLDGLMRNNR